MIIALVKAFYAISVSGVPTERDYCFLIAVFYWWQSIIDVVGLCSVSLTGKVAKNDCKQLDGGGSMEATSRIFSIAKFLHPSDGEPIRSVVLVTEEAAIVVWHVRPGQEITAHVHPHGQDTWMVISGVAEYYQGGGVVTLLKAGEVAVARPGQAHGAMNSGSEPFTFVSVVAPGNAGYALAEQ